MGGSESSAPSLSLNFPVCTMEIFPTSLPRTGFPDSPQLVPRLKVHPGSPSGGVGQKQHLSLTSNLGGGHRSGLEAQFFFFQLVYVARGKERKKVREGGRREEKDLSN